MKKIIYLIVFILFTLPSHAQSIKVRKLKKLHVTHEAWFPSFGSNSREVLLTGQNYKGLVLYNTRTKKETKISDDPGAGYNVELKSNSEITYRVSKGSRGERKFEYKSYNLTTKSHVATKSAVTEGIQVSVNGKQIELNKPGEEVKIITPVEDRYFVWASLSPDKKNILFTAVGKGTYVSDLDGNIIAELGYLNAPSWINNQWVVGMDDKDDGHTTTSSEVIAIHVSSGEKQSISGGKNEIAMYPKASSKGDRIVFHNEKGEIIIVKIRIR
ncbi:MAG: hypothetical protein U9N53_12215 [Bacteroidota bacterium]|nr:hypothetical protein [Bacteroidota bacterium]